MMFIKKKPFLFSLLALLLFSCDKFEYNTFETNAEKDELVTTAYNISRLLGRPAKDTIHIVFTGDTQRFYDEVDDLVTAVNEIPKVDLLILTGDLTDFGLKREYGFINESLKRLKIPFLTVIGNHDCLANGTKLYEDIYGPLNYSFTWNGIRFVMHNTNSREFDFNGNVPDLSWMNEQIADTNYSGSLFVSHIPPFDPDFDNNLEENYASLIRNARGTILSTNGHRHGFLLDQPYYDGIWYLNTSSPSNRIYCHVTIYPNAEDKKFDCIAVPY